MEGEQIAYSEAMAQLEEIVGRIDRGEVDVDELAGAVQRAVALVRMCRERLRSTQAEVEQALREMEEDRATMSGGPLTEEVSEAVVDGPRLIDVFAEE